MKKLYYIFFSITLSIVITACGSSGGSDDKVITIAGKVIDNYIKNATVCIDTNKNDFCDSGEETTISDSNGDFSFTKVISNDDVVIAYGGVDIHTGDSFNYIVKNIVENKDNANKVILSSINTLITDYKILTNSDLKTA